MSLRNISLVSDQVKNEQRVSIKKDPEPIKKEKKEKKEVGKKRTHKQMKISKFLDVEAKEEDESEEDCRRTTTKSEIKAESGRSSRVC